LICPPNLASQHRQYLDNQLMACRDGGRSHRRWTFSPVKMSRDELQAIVLFDTVVALTLVQVG
jgi:cytochrome c553